MKKYLKLLRMQQWYKNVVVFIPLFFSLNAMNPYMLMLCAGGFAALSLMSSCYYILNDLKDAEEDRRHPEKRKRPVASGEVSKKAASAVAAALFAASISLSYALNPAFAVFPLLLLLVTMFYTFRLRNVAIVDIHAISVNFLIRTVSGAVLIGVSISPWLVITIFLLALVLASGKRRAELEFLGKHAEKHRPVYRVYTGHLLDAFLMVSVSLLLMSYTLYTFIAHPEGYLVFTLPVATFLLFRYMYFAVSGGREGRSAEHVLRDPQMVAGIAVWVAAVFLGLYVIA